jgi:zinc transporter ZupT
MQKKIIQNKYFFNKCIKLVFVLIFFCQKFFINHKKSLYFKLYGVVRKLFNLKSFAIISMIGDFIHNFTDGLSIGVAYGANYKIGVVTTMAMLFHEIPHEVGDFALLVSLKFSLW